MSYTSGNTTSSAFPILDMMLQMQQIGLRAMTLYRPVTSAFLDAVADTERAAATDLAGARRGRASREAAGHEAAGERVIAVGEEVLNVGTRVVPGKTTRVRRVVVESPVQQDVTLHTETVVLERRRPQTSIGQDVLTEVTIEMSETNEVPVVSKSVHLVEEVLLRKEVTARTETIRDTIKRDKLEIEAPSQLPVVFNPEQKQDDRKRPGGNQERKQSVASIHAEGKSGETRGQEH
ncbi:YsnF/AvaK domain-containing protein [Rhodopila globiformis]|nr:YsnF/AvaK domain-containing protein [Rhodopila globiformis]